MRNKRENSQIHIFGFHFVAKHIEGWLNMCTLFLAYNQVWLNLPTHNRHFGYKQKFLIQNTLPGRHYVCSSPQGLRGSVPDSLSAHMHWKLTVCSATQRQFDHRDSALLCSAQRPLCGPKEWIKTLAYLPGSMRDGWMDGWWVDMKHFSIGFQFPL